MHTSQDAEAFADAEPPPPYSSIADGANSTTVEANFSRPFEVPDSGTYSPRPAHNTSSSISSTPASTFHQSRYSQPVGPPPPSPHGQNGSSSAFRPPPQHTTSQHQHQHDLRHPQPHTDGVSTFNRPALPNQPPAHTVSPASSRTPYLPTSTPTGGQPLLLQGKLLMFPSGFHCPKCCVFIHKQIPEKFLSR